MLKKTNLNTIFLFALFGLFFVALIGIFYPFFYVILWASLLYIVLNPLHKKIQQKITKKKRFLEIKRHALATIFQLPRSFLLLDLFYS